MKTVLPACWAVSLLLGCGVVGCLVGGGPGGPEGVVATVDGEPITGRELYEAFWSAPTEVKQRATRPGGRHALLDQVIAERLLLHEARRRGLSLSFSQRQEVLAEATKSFLAAEFEKTVRLEDIPEEEVREAFEKKRSSLGQPERIRLEILAAPEKVGAESLLQQARAATEPRELETLVSLHRFEPLPGGILSRDEATARLGPAAADLAFSLGPPDRIVAPELVPLHGVWAVLVVPSRYQGQEATFEEHERALRLDMFLAFRSQRLTELVKSFPSSGGIKTFPAHASLVPWTAPVPEQGIASAGESEESIEEAAQEAGQGSMPASVRR